MLMFLASNRPHRLAAAEFVRGHVAASMGIPPHPGSSWCDPDVQQRKRDELAAEQQRHADLYAKAGKDETDRINRGGAPAHRTAILKNFHGTVICG
jgi:hypothetical protein